MDCGGWGREFAGGVSVWERCEAVKVAMAKDYRRGAVGAVNNGRHGESQGQSQSRTATHVAVP